jgi:hypothetical protein
MYNAKLEGGLSVLANMNRDFQIKTLREERLDEQGDEREFEITNYIHNVGIEMQRSMRKKIKQVNKHILDIVDALDFQFNGQDVIVHGLRYVISKEMELKDPERPGNTRNEYLMLLKTSVENYNDLLS